MSSDRIQKRYIALIEASQADLNPWVWLLTDGRHW